MAVGVTVSKNKNKNLNASTSGSSSDSSSSSSSGSGAVKSDPSDPSNFEKDPNLHNAFYGIAYTPTGAIMPACGANLSACLCELVLARGGSDSAAVQRTSSPTFSSCPKSQTYAHAPRRSA